MPLRLTTLLAVIVAAGCGGGNNMCTTACAPACAAGTICSADLGGHTSATWTGACLKTCSQPSDCTGGLTCRSFGDGVPYVCASDTLPVLCADLKSYTDDQVGDLPACVDAQTIAVPFDASRTNATRGHELQTCANGCEELGATGDPPARCR